MDEPLEQYLKIGSTVFFPIEENSTGCDLSNLPLTPSFIRRGNFSSIDTVNAIPPPL